MSISKWKPKNDQSQCSEARWWAAWLDDCTFDSIFFSTFGQFFSSFEQCFFFLTFGHFFFTFCTMSDSTFFIFQTTKAEAVWCEGCFKRSIMRLLAFALSAIIFANLSPCLGKYTILNYLPMVLFRTFIYIYIYLLNLRTSQHEHFCIIALLARESFFRRVWAHKEPSELQQARALLWCLNPAKYLIGEQYTNMSNIQIYKYVKETNIQICQINKYTNMSNKQIY